MHAIGLCVGRQLHTKKSASKPIYIYSTKIAHVYESSYTRKMAIEFTECTPPLHRHNNNIIAKAIGVPEKHNACHGVLKGWDTDTGRESRRPNCQNSPGRWTILVDKLHQITPHLIKNLRVIKVEHVVRRHLLRRETYYELRRA